MTKRADFVRSRREKRRNQIFEGAVKVFAKKGFHGATTQEIADTAGIAKGTMYEYVRTKEDILLLAIEESICMINNEIAEALLESDAPKEQLKKAVFVQLKFAINYRSAARVMMNEMNGLSTDRKKRCSELINEHIKILSSIIEDGIKLGCFKSIDSGMTAELIIHAAKFCFDYGDLPHQKANLDDVRDFIMDNVIYAIVTTNTKNGGC